MRVQPFTQRDLDDIIERVEAMAVDGLKQAVHSPRGIITAATFQSVSLDDLGLLATRWAKWALNVIMPELFRVFTHGAEMVRGQIFTDTEGLPSPSELFQNPAVSSFMTRAENRLRGVGNDLWEHARSQVALGLDKGETIDQLAARVSDAAGLTEPRARTVARTEAAAAGNAGALYELRSYELEAVKEWLATNDEDTRPTHREADGQSTDITGRFRVGEALLDFPGDPTGPPGEVINCRCTLVYEIADDDVEALVSAAEKFQRPNLNCPKDARWGTPGDFTRCVRIMRKHVRNPEGFCADCHKQMTGKWPGEDRG